jgi:hypothetical protein
MKSLLLILVLVYVLVMGGTVPAQAFFSPYPNVLSRPIDILPQGATTINAGDDTFYYCKGIFYQKIMRLQKYVIVPPPIGAVVFTIPQGYQLLLIDETPYYEYQGVWYRRVLEGYKVVFPPAQIE